MEPPFPGMDPYLESAEYWAGFHLPTLPIPLLAPDPDVPLDLAAALRQIYARARYARRIDYRADPPSPELRPTEAEWLAAWLREQGLR